MFNPLLKLYTQYNKLPNIYKDFPQTIYTLLIFTDKLYIVYVHIGMHNVQAAPGQLNVLHLIFSFQCKEKFF